MTVNGQAYIISLYDTPTDNALYDSLPMNLNFTDYAGTEKIAAMSGDFSAVIERV